MNYSVTQLINDCGNPAANQFAIKTEKASYFKSYNSVICKLDGSSIILSNHWEHSNTTRKHLYIFFRQNGFYTLSSKKGILKAIKDGRVTLKNVNSLDIV